LEVGLERLLALVVLVPRIGCGCTDLRNFFFGNCKLGGPSIEVGAAGSHSLFRRRQSHGPRVKVGHTAVGGQGISLKDLGLGIEQCIGPAVSIVCRSNGGDGALQVLLEAGKLLAQGVLRSQDCRRSAGPLGGGNVIEAAGVGGRPEGERRRRLGEVIVTAAGEVDVSRGSGRRCGLGQDGRRRSGARAHTGDGSNIGPWPLRQRHGGLARGFGGSGCGSGRLIAPGRGRRRRQISFAGLVLLGCLVLLVLLVRFVLLVLLALFGRRVER
jgi:hypothetical protein